MLIDPKRQRRKRARKPGHDVKVPIVVIVALAAEVACLAELREWYPVGSKLEQLIEVVQGEGSLTRFDVERLRTMASNWGAISDPVRSFYMHNHDEFGVNGCLWYVLGVGTEPSGFRIGLLRRAYTDAYGYEPSIDLLPTPATQDRT